MKNILVIGGSKGIGKAIITNLVEENHVYNVSRTSPDFSHNNLTHFSLDILTDELP